MVSVEDHKHEKTKRQKDTSRPLPSKEKDFVMEPGLQPKLVAVNIKGNVDFGFTCVAVSE